ncbi:hypothetical protein BGZ47_002772 [Haplosporangium gracile]|nr:hypothetical protein BGZ47_002772 [Haplosporangium gracile]
MYTTNNSRYLRISKHSVLPLNLLLPKDDLAWFNDYSFQEILTMLKPIVLSRIELFNQGHIIKRTINPIATNSSSTSSEDGLEDAGFVLGGEQQQPSEESSTTTRAKRRTAAERPQFGVRFGFRIHTPSERGGAVLVADKNLGFMRIKTEEEGPSASQRTSGRRTSMGLASLEGEAPADEGGPVIVREEDESDNLRVSDFQQGGDDQDQEDAEDDGDYLDASASQRHGGGDGGVDGTAGKRKNPETATHGRRKGKRAKATVDEPPSQTDLKPTLQISYKAMKLHPQTLYIVVRSLDSGLPSLSSILPFTTAVEPTSATDKKEAAATTIATASTVQEDEESLFPPGLDYFIDS